jgi:hypothetical protein
LGSAAGRVTFGYRARKKTPTDDKGDPMTIMTGVDVEPHMRRVLLLTAGDLDDFTYKPGQALVLVVPGQGGETGPARLYDPQVRSGCPNAQH